MRDRSGANTLRAKVVSVLLMVQVVLAQCADVVGIDEWGGILMWCDSVWCVLWYAKWQYVRKVV